MNKKLKIILTVIMISTAITVAGCNKSTETAKSTENNTVQNTKPGTNSTEVDNNANSGADANTNDKTTTANTSNGDANTDSNANTNTNSDVNTASNGNTSKDSTTTSTAGTAATEKTSLPDEIKQYIVEKYGDKSLAGKDRIKKIDEEPGNDGKKTLVININGDTDDSTTQVLKNMNKTTKDIILKVQQTLKPKNTAEDLFIQYYLPIGNNQADEMVYEISINGSDLLDKDWKSISDSDLKSNADSFTSNDDYFSLNP